MNPRYAFDLGRKQLNMPIADVIFPMNLWNIPANYVVDYILEEVRDENDNPVPLETLWKTHEIEILPESRSDIALSMSYAGLTDEGTIAFYVLGADSKDVYEAFGILIAGRRYSVVGSSDEPIGDPLFTLVSCKLWE